MHIARWSACFAACAKAFATIARRWSIACAIGAINAQLDLNPIRLFPHTTCWNATTRFTQYRTRIHMYPCSIATPVCLFVTITLEDARLSNDVTCCTAPNLWPSLRVLANSALNIGYAGSACQHCACVLVHNLGFQCARLPDDIIAQLARAYRAADAGRLHACEGVMPPCRRSQNSVPQLSCCSRARPGTVA
jgi:hypothetical protein